MKVLVIPDIHLKPWMFQRAAKIMEQGTAERAVCLMDIPDDWNQEYNLELYNETFDAAIAFARKYPDTFWVYADDITRKSEVWSAKYYGGLYM